MKRILIACLLLLFFQQADAQQDTLPIYRRFPVVPVFSITTAPDSIKFTKDDLKKKRPTIIILFSPDCDHCQHATRDLLEHIDLFKKVQIVMVSSMDYSHIKKFYQDFHIAAHPNITMGWDAAFMLSSFYKIQQFPSLFIYDKKGDFVKAFEGTFPMKTVAKEL